ncbi:MAG TPA: TorF family putative porin [Hydrogenophaga sp.]
MRTHRCLSTALAILLTGAAAPSMAQEMASFAASTEIKISSDQRSRGISDSFNRPGVKLSVQAAHESGLIGLAELATVSKKQFLGGDGLAITLAGGYRFGDPDGWHYGVGLATELFPGAKFTAPHSFDMATGTPTDWRSSRYDSAFALAEIGYGALEGRVMNVISKNYRGANTGGVCGTMLSLMADPTDALACYGRGDHNSRGTWLFDLGYKIELDPNTTLHLHSGYQKVANFKEANFSDYSIGLSHNRWGFTWSAEWVTTRTKVRELYIATDGSKTRATDGNRLVVSVAHSF